MACVNSRWELINRSKSETTQIIATDPGGFDRTRVGSSIPLGTSYPQCWKTLIRERMARNDLSLG